jgi:hypothetical protein
VINTDGDGASVTQPAGLEPPLLPEPTPQPASSEVGAATARSVITGRHHERAHEGPVHLEQSRQLSEHRARKTELNLRRVFGYGLLLAVVAEIIFLNAVFVIYATKNDWHIDGTTIQVWLGATVVQVVGLAGVVVKYLFSADAAPR